MSQKYKSSAIEAEPHKTNGKLYMPVRISFSKQEGSAVSGKTPWAKNPGLLP